MPAPITMTFVEVDMVSPGDVLIEMGGDVEFS
jgi:hypothetical protein